ncbi:MULTISPECIES: amino acid synthesis family protein [unclassified Leucobacter]|uniref:amino acid synthesis family protein n=1 Tax=unclassified Leucobacter TaxID=2621730 RepID=UPI00165E97C0|nr:MULTISPECIES: amino acid synthesis family protein [unclassified Leucobacter]MBC9926201.1 amino acid synthesis family protein [Leucobacter sp. cx-169]
MNAVIDGYEIRAWHSSVVEVTELAGRQLEEPLVKAAVGVVIRNPFAGQPFQQDLSALTAPSGELAFALGTRAKALLGGREVEGYGKGGVAGIAGEQEHVVACVTTIFGNGFRDAVGGGKAWISSMTKVSSAGVTLDIPLAFKDEVYVRDYYDGITLHVADSPKPDELLICVAVSSGGRPNARVGGMTKAEALAQR